MGGQRDATDNLNTLFAKIVHNVRMEAIDFRAARDEDLAASDGLAGRGTFERGGELLFCFGDLDGHVERVDFEKAGSLVE